MSETEDASVKIASAGKEQIGVHIEGLVVVLNIKLPEVSMGQQLLRPEPEIKHMPEAIKQLRIEAITKNGSNSMISGNEQCRREQLSRRRGAEVIALVGNGVTGLEVAVE